MTPQSPSSAGGSAALLQNLTGDTDAAVDRLTSSVGVSLIEQVNQLETQFTEAGKLEGPQRDTRMQVLQATFAQVRAGFASDEKDLAQVVFGINALFEQLGEEYSKLQEPSAEEQAVMARAKEVLEAARAAAQSPSGGLFGLFAKSNKAKADQALAEAEVAFKVAEKEVARKVRDRLMTASFEHSLQEYMLRVRKVIDLMRQRQKITEGEVKAVATRRAEAAKLQQAAAEALERIEAELQSAEQAQFAKEEEIKGLLNGSTERTVAETQLADLKAQTENLRGNRNIAMGVFQSKERFASELQVHEQAQIKLRDNQRLWIAVLQSDTEERVVTIKSRLEAQKALADQDVASELNAAGREIDKRNTLRMAEIGVASDNHALAMMESSPEALRQLEEIRAAQVEAQGKVRDRYQDLVEEFRNRYGIDPTQTSLSRYSGSQPAAAA